MDNAVEFAYLNPQTSMQRIGREQTASSQLSIWHTGDPHRFRGSVKSDATTCKRDRNVVIKKVRGGSDRVVARTTTNRRGQYFASHNLGGAGRYYAVAQRQTFVDDLDETTCTMARSVTKPSTGRATDDGPQRRGRPIAVPSCCLAID